MIYCRLISDNFVLFVDYFSITNLTDYEVDKTVDGPVGISHRGRFVSFILNRNHCPFRVSVPWITYYAQRRQEMNALIKFINEYCSGSWSIMVDGSAVFCFMKAEDALLFKMKL